MPNAEKNLSKHHAWALQTAFVLPNLGARAGRDLAQLEVMPRLRRRQQPRSRRIEEHRLPKCREPARAEHLPRPEQRRWRAVRMHDHCHRHHRQRHWQREWAIGQEEQARGWWRHDGAVGPDERGGAETAEEAAGARKGELVVDLLADDPLAPRRGLPLERRGRRLAL